MIRAYRNAFLCLAVAFLLVGLPWGLEKWSRVPAEWSLPVSGAPTASHRLPLLWPGAYDMILSVDSAALRAVSACQSVNPNESFEDPGPAPTEVSCCREFSMGVIDWQLRRGDRVVASGEQDAEIWCPGQGRLQARIDSFPLPGVGSFYSLQLSYPGIPSTLRASLQPRVEVRLREFGGLWVVFAFILAGFIALCAIVWFISGAVQTIAPLLQRR